MTQVIYLASSEGSKIILWCSVLVACNFLASVELIVVFQMVENALGYNSDQYSIYV